MKICHTCQHTYPDDTEFCPRDGAHLAAQATEPEAQLAAGLSRRFRLVRRLGAGGMGTVFLAEQIGVGNRLVALKVLNRKLLDDPDFLLRFQNEAGSTGRISQENVVSIYESAQADDGAPYIAMEFLEGESLRQALQQRGALPVPEVAEILQQAARGLNAAHKLGVIHRDLKPDNIFLTRNAENEVRVKIVDFGIAKLRESAMHTQTGVVLGTPAYMSSEQAYGMRSDELDARSDIYSLGVVVYEMLTGCLPFHSDTPAGFLRKHLMEEPPPFRAVAPSFGVAPAVESAVMKAIVKNRDQRYPSALDFARAFMAAAQPPPRAEATLPPPTTRIVSPPSAEVSQPLPSTNVVSPPAAREFVASTPVLASASPPPAVVRPPQYRSLTKSPSQVKYVILGLVLLAVIAGAVWYFSRSAAPSPPNVTSLSSDAGKSAEVTPPPQKPPEPKPAQIVIQTSPNAQVYLDDVFKGQAGPQGRLAIDNAKPGDLALRISLVGKRDYEQKVTVIAGQVTRIRAGLSDTVGTVVVQTSPGAEVFLDSASRGTTDASGQLAIPKVAGGRHELRVAAAGKTEYQQRIMVPAGQVARVKAVLAELGPSPNPRAIDKLQILALISGDIPQDRIAAIIRERGIKFSPTTDDLEDIRKAGGSDEVIQAIQRAAPGGK